MTNVRSITAVVLLLSLTACKVGPNYQRPPLSVPGDYRGVAPDATAQQQGPAPPQTDFAQMKWWTVLQDDTLQALIKEALANNYDMRIAATRILQASANLGITRANQFPTLNGRLRHRQPAVHAVWARLADHRHRAAPVELHRRLLGTVSPRD